MARPKDTKKDRLPILKEEFDHLIEVIKRDKEIPSNSKKKLLRAFTILYYSGCRISEIASFTIKDIANIVNKSNFVLEKTKTKTVQLLRFNKKAIDIIAALPYSDCKEAIFYKNGSSKPMNSQSLEKLLNKYLKDKLNQLYTTHSFRAGYITQICEASNLAVAQKLARHRDRETTVRYLSASPKAVDKALDSVFA